MLSLASYLGVGRQVQMVTVVYRHRFPFDGLAGKMAFHIQVRVA